MATTVYFATNRIVGNALDPTSYSPTMVELLHPERITYGTAFVDGINIATNNSGAITGMGEVATGGWPAGARDDLSQPGRDLLVFVHGFDNSFSDAITRAAFNREWLAASGQPHTDTTVIAFAWPSLGQVVTFPILQKDYLTDQHMAAASGIHIMAFFANLLPAIQQARARGRRVTLLAHSMGNLALQAAVEAWFLQGNGPADLFDQVILAAGDCTYDAFGFPNLARLSGLSKLSKKTSICYSHNDQVLQLSMAVNRGAQRLGQDGPLHRTDTAAFPSASFTMLDCTQFQDYAFDFMSSHQYYRQSKGARQLIAAQLA